LPQWRRAEPNSFENPIYVAARALYERLFDAPDIESQIRDRDFDEYLRESYLLYYNASDEVARQDWRDFCSSAWRSKKRGRRSRWVAFSRCATKSNAPTRPAFLISAKACFTRVTEPF
jgi:hypothetical protein